MKLVVVESPNKIKKIKSYLGSDYEVIATVGHFCDLPKRDLGVDMDTMRPTYKTDPKKKDVVSKLKTKTSKASQVLIATDPDREGEAIGWHVIRVCKVGSKSKRIDFHEITKAAVNRAVANPRPLDDHLVNAQQARRVLDRIVGYKVSPLLRPLGRGLSAGRVQTATLHLVCKREREILNFNPEPYWMIQVKYTNGLLAEMCDRDDKPQRFTDEHGAKFLWDLSKISPHDVVKVDRTEKLKKAPAPFTTSTLQQVASTRLKMSPKQTMATAQKLFEMGLITYHRTDSFFVSDDAVAMARSWIVSNRPGSLPEQAPKYKAKAGAQEAHEAIRPTSLETPGKHRSGSAEALSDAEINLWKMIATRFLASQMKPAKLAVTTVITKEMKNSLSFVAKGTEVLEEHWLSIERAEHPSPEPSRKRRGGTAQDAAGTASPEETPDDEPKDQDLPNVQEGDQLTVAQATNQEKQTKPPPRYNEASLVKAMERLGIGRPSTFASIIEILFKRLYIEPEHEQRNKRNVKPTALGLQVDDMMLKGLAELTSHEYTAEMESHLDKIAAGQMNWIAYLQNWWNNDFRHRLAEAAQKWGFLIEDLKARAKKGDKKAQKTIGHDPDAPDCPECSKTMTKRRGNSGYFWGCGDYPNCKGILAIAATKPGRAKDAKATAIECPECSKPMVERRGVHGKFLGCSGYPECNKILPIEMTRKRQKKCPKCGAVMAKRTGPKGAFFGCSSYPKCKHTEDAGKKHPNPRRDRT